MFVPLEGEETSTVPGLMGTKDLNRSSPANDPAVANAARTSAAISRSFNDLATTNTTLALVSARIDQVISVYSGIIL